MVVVGAVDMATLLVDVTLLVVKAPVITTEDVETLDEGVTTEDVETLDEGAIT